MTVEMPPPIAVAKGLSGRLIPWLLNTQILGQSQGAVILS